MKNNISKTIKFFIVTLSILILTACGAKAKHDQDPFEPINRGVYNFNKAVDSMYIKPVAAAYQKFVPPPVRGAVGNVVQNVNEVPTFINDILQGKIAGAGTALLRLTVNSTLGVFGLFDVANEFGLKPHTETLANTFVRWGYEKSNYFVIPFLGPTTARDTLGLIGNTFMTPAYYFDANYRDKYYLVSLIDKRESLLDLQEVVDAAASVDEYAFIRDAYFQKRASLLEKEGEISEADQKYLDEPPE